MESFSLFDSTSSISSYFQASGDVPLSSLRTAGVTFLLSGLIAIASPKEWTPLRRSFLIAMLHSIISFAFATGIFWHHYKDMLAWASHTPSDKEIWFGYDTFHSIPVAIAGGYLSFDLILGTVIAPGMIDLPMILHHVVGIAASIMGCVFGYGLPLHALVLINEGTNPFTNGHFFFGWRGWKRTMNGLLMWLSYFFLRICYAILLTRLFFQIWLNEDSIISTQWESQRGGSADNVERLGAGYGYHPLVFWVQFVLGLFLQLMNVMWFVKITKGLAKSMRQTLGYEKETATVVDGEEGAEGVVKDAIATTTTTKSSSTSRKEVSDHTVSPNGSTNGNEMRQRKK